MAIAYPRELPNVRWLEQPVFDLLPVESTNRAGGSEQNMELGSPYWTARYMTVPLTWPERAAVIAWKDTLRGGRTFYASDPFRWWPAAYGRAALGLVRHAGGAFDGSAKLLANNIVSVQISTLATNQKIRTGDMIELPRPDGRISLHQAVEDVTAAAGVATVTIEPPAFADAVINSVNVRMIKARCIMVVRSGTFSAPAGAGRRSASFEAVQTLG